MTIKRIANLRAQRIARPKSRGLQTVRSPDFQDPIPNRLNLMARANHFKTIFAGVAGAPDPERDILKDTMGQLIFFEFTRLAMTRRRLKTLINEPCHFRPLNRDCPMGIRNVAKLRFEVDGASAEAPSQREQSV